MKHAVERQGFVRGGKAVLVKYLACSRRLSDAYTNPYLCVSGQSYRLQDGTVVDAVAALVVEHKETER